MTWPSRDNKAVVLGDVGERKIIKRVIIPALGGDLASGELGGDCTFVEVGKTVLAVSTDVGPRPLIWQLPGCENDFEAAGWYAVLATASDIATAGAVPMYLTNCIEAPRDLLVAQLEEFVRGFARACRRFGFKNAGGDIREGRDFGCRVSGVGDVVSGRRIGRRGAKPGDHLYCIGEMGMFVTSFLEAALHGMTGMERDAIEHLRFPVAKCEEMRILAREGLVSAASDASDGVLAAMQNVLQESRLGAHLELEAAKLRPRVHAAARDHGYDAWNLAFCWGDWQIIAVVPANESERAKRVCANAAIECKYMGVCAPQNNGITADVDGSRVRVQPSRNENFSKCSYNRNAMDHLHMMLSKKLFTAL